MPAAYEADLVFVDRSTDRRGHPLAFRCLITGRDIGALWNEDPDVWRWRYMGEDAAGPLRREEIRGTVRTREEAMLAIATAFRASSPEACDRARMQYHRRLGAAEGTYPIT